MSITPAAPPAYAAVIACHALIAALSRRASGSAVSPVFTCVHERGRLANWETEEPAASTRNLGSPRGNNGRCAHLLKVWSDALIVSTVYCVECSWGRRFVERSVHRRSGTTSSPVLLAFSDSIPHTVRPPGAGRVLLELQRLRTVTSVRGSIQVRNVMPRPLVLV